jgi:hypothetical protein
LIIYYLYIKTHTKTGLKYLGYTKRNPYTYTGSGVYWIRHLKEHGFTFDTKILFESNSKQEIKSHGLYYSKLWNIVDAKGKNGKKIWANLKPEEGDGGSIPRTTPVPAYVGKKISDKLKGRVNGPHSKERCTNISKGKKGNNKGLTYTQIYGTRAQELRNDRSIKLKKYLKENPDVRLGSKNGNAKHYEFIDPAGKKYQINGTIVSFCKSNKLNLTGVYKCINGQLASYKNWKIARLVV